LDPDLYEPEIGFLIWIYFWPVLRIQDVYHGSEFFHLGSRTWLEGQKDSGSRIRIKELNCFFPKNIFLDVHPGSGIISIPDPGVKAPDSGSATLPRAISLKDFAIVKPTTLRKTKMIYISWKVFFISGYPFPVDGPERERHLPGDCEEAAQGWGCGTGRLRQQWPRNFREISAKFWFLF
jgi:hypothetical protein